MDSSGTIQSDGPEDDEGAATALEVAGAPAAGTDDVAPTAVQSKVRAS